MEKKIMYVGGPLTELEGKDKETAKRFYERIADVCEELMGVRAYVPHEHYDPVAHADFTPKEVDASERRQVCENTSLLIMVTIAPSWGGGIEVEMANQSGVPVVILAEKEKLEQRKISRLLRGNPAVRKIIAYSDKNDALLKLKEFLAAFKQ